MSTLLVGILDIYILFIAHSVWNLDIHKLSIEFRVLYKYQLSNYYLLLNKKTNIYIFEVCVYIYMCIKWLNDKYYIYACVCTCLCQYWNMIYHIVLKKI